nr:MAG TPA: hypothetical protein [Caudoviricetes sp.]
MNASTIRSSFSVISFAAVSSTSRSRFSSSILLFSLQKNDLIKFC